MSWPILLPASALALGVSPDGSVQGSDRILCSVALTSTLFIEHGDTPAVRDGIRALYREYVALLGAPMSWGADPTSGEPVELAHSPWGDLEAWPLELWNQVDLRIMFHAGKGPDDAPPARFLALSRETEEDELSVVSCSFPLTWSSRHSPSDFASFVRKQCEAMRPSHGYAGLGICPHFTGLDVESEPIVRKLGRHAGLTLDMPEETALRLYHRTNIAATGWLTALSDATVARVGGPHDLAHKLSPLANVHPYAGGVIVMAGFSPQWDGSAEERRVGLVLESLLEGEG